MESRRRSSRAVADKHDPQDHKPAGAEGSIGPGGLSSEDDAEDVMVSITGTGRRSHHLRGHHFFRTDRDESKSRHGMASSEAHAYVKEERHPRFLFLT